VGWTDLWRREIELGKDGAVFSDDLSYPLVQIREGEGSPDSSVVCVLVPVFIIRKRAFYGTIRTGVSTAVEDRKDRQPTHYPSLLARKRHLNQGIP
jgi:hypothetical protein